MYMRGITVHTAYNFVYTTPLPVDVHLTSGRNAILLEDYTRIVIMIGSHVLHTRNDVRYAQIHTRMIKL